ncbi:EVE domain-containing protein [Olleya namhaensis]|uniref:EVE domain-containing protein n=1 Tax=Olleya namhaensis TaxID=1144750 RepID=UPI00248FAC8E|nr:EVE domain-containing protein [Olleya namhaensis]
MMLFSKVTKGHILQGIKDFEEKGFPNGFGPSSTYDVLFNNKTYPPKAIMAYANFHAEGRTIERYFKGGLNTDCFNAFKRNGFEVVKKNKTSMHNELYALKQEFLNSWPIEKLETMILAEYTNLDREDSFCYWVEQKTKSLGDVRGGSSYKFGIYKMADTSKTEKASNRNNNGDYAWHNKYGNTQVEAFNAIKTIIIKIAKAAQNNNLEAIDAIDLGNAYKWKIAFLFGDYNCLNVFTIDALRVIASNLEIAYNNKTSISKFHNQIIKSKPEDKEFYSWSHELWRQYEARLRNVKKDFAKWLNVNTFDSYRNFLGETNKSIENRLDEINDYFDEIDFFVVDPNNINGLVSAILFVLSKKERLKNLDFVEYDSKNSNGIPKAILGKNNYIKFLKENYDYTEPNYWVFQGNPNVYNITKALEAGHLKSWKVAAHKDKIKIGDKVILWQTGKNAGCYALAEIISEVSVFEEEKVEEQYYVNPLNSSSTDRVKLRVIKNLVYDPILWNDLKEDPAFTDFKAGNQGTNFSASKEEYETLLELLDKDDASIYTSIISKFPKEKLDQYISILKEFVSNNNLSYDDNRTSLNVRKSKNRLVLIIGSRYGFVIEGTGENTVFSFVSDKIISEKHEQYNDKSGNPENSYYNTVNEITPLKIDVLEGCKTELDKGYKSPYRKYENIDFINAVFNLAIKHDKKGNTTTSNTTNMIVNQILYGPPGTGKTFYLKDQLFDKYTSKETSISQEQNFETVVGSCSWWQVIGIALLDMGTSKVSDIFEHKWVMKKANLSNSKTIRPTLWGQLQSHTVNECVHVNVSSRQQPLIFNKTEDSYWEILEDQVKELVPELYDLKEAVENYNPDPDKIINNYDFVTFHQSFAYEDFIEGIKPISPEEGEESKELGYRIENGVFKELCIKAKNDPDNKYAIFIDEINRGNVSAIFGELITLIEVDKRQGAKNEMSIKLPYSKTEFSVPSNIDIYGTMNTADRSVEALDTALRRRFEFKEMMPDENVIKQESVGGLMLSNVLRKINERIELLIDRDHTIGHSYFVGVDTEQKLANAFNNKIIPLLQEYFYGDYGKIGLILGNGFVFRKDNKSAGFADFKYENANDFITNTFILNKVDSNTVLDAVRQLLGIKDAE